MQDRDSSLESPKNDETISSFLTNLRNRTSRALLLDYDGTLAPFSEDPRIAVPYSCVPEVLDRIRHETDTRLVIVTGRSIQDVTTLLNLEGLEIWGCHGLERLKSDGTHEQPNLDGLLLARIETANKLIAKEGISDFAESKPGSIAIHWRGKEGIAGHIRHRALRVWATMPDRTGLRLAPFDCGIEIRVTAPDKGDVVRTVLSEIGSDAAVAYLGDDTTDEDAFGALHRRGLNVLVRNEFRSTLADAWIQPPEGLYTFLSAWIEAAQYVRK